MKSVPVITRLMFGAMLGVGLALPATLFALEVHKWIDEHGVVHYSGSPPAASADLAGMETFELNDDYKTSEPNYKSTLELAQELEASRLARERLRAREAAPLSGPSSGSLIVVPSYNDSNGVYPMTSPYYPSGYYDHRAYDKDYPYDDYFPYNTSSGLQRGSFVPSVKQRSFFHNPAARARAMGGDEALQLQ